jgi:1-aminocyclopropane-1-carboxylate deaminase
MFGINCIGIVRGEEQKDLSHTLLFCKKEGMQLDFISRQDYKRKYDEDFKMILIEKYGDHILIPEGGYSKQGVDGAALITDFYNNANFTHICSAVGTATTLAGLIRSTKTHQKVIGFSALKQLTDFESRIEFLLGKPLEKKYFINNDYHFGGVAKSTEELLFFMNTFYKSFTIATDFIYTAKMMFGVFDLIKKDQFTEGSNILCIHTGGLQGNYSLPEGALNF